MARFVFYVNIDNYDHASVDEICEALDKFKSRIYNDPVQFFHSSEKIMFIGTPGPSHLEVIPEYYE